MKISTLLTYLTLLKAPTKTIQVVEFKLIISPQQNKLNGPTNITSSWKPKKSLAIPLTFKNTSSTTRLTLSSTICNVSLQDIINNSSFFRKKRLIMNAWYFSALLLSYLTIGKITVQLMI